MSFNRAAAFCVLAIGFAGCGGGSVATTPVPQPTATPVTSITAATGIPVPVGGGVVTLPAAGGMAETMTFRPGNPAGLFLNNVQAFAFGQTSFGSATPADTKRRPQDVGNITFAVCPLVTAVSFTVSVETPLAQLGDYGFSPLSFYESGFGNGTFSLQLYHSTYQTGTVDNANWVLEYHAQPDACKRLLLQKILGDPGKPDAGVFTLDLTGTGTFSNGTLVSFPFSPAQLGSVTLNPNDGYLLLAMFTPGATSTSSPNPIPTITPTPSPSSTPTPTPTPLPTPTATATPTPAPTAAPSAAGTLSIAPGAGNMFLGNPPAPLGSFSPSLFYNGTIAGILSPMSAPYIEALGSTPHACAVNGTIVYSLEVTYPTAFAFATATAGYMSTIVAPGTADGTAYHAGLFRAGGCAQLQGPDNIAVSGGTLTFDGAGALTIAANETDVVEFWH